MHPARLKKINRCEQILLSLKKFDFLTRKQIQSIHNLKGDRNAQRVLKQMDLYLNNFYDGQNIYYLNKKGREYVNCDVIRKKATTTQHYLMRNNLYIHCGQPETWENEIRIISGQDKRRITIVADALFSHNGRNFIIEIDNMQKMNKNRIKIDKYRRLIERNSFGNNPVLIWVTTSTYRQERLLELCEGLDVKIFLNTDIN